MAATTSAGIFMMEWAKDGKPEWHAKMHATYEHCFNHYRDDVYRQKSTRPGMAGDAVMCGLTKWFPRLPVPTSYDAE